ncbi:MAG: hypothetical protein ACHP79_19895, partial [Terriglobales bacterium]
RRPSTLGRWRSRADIGVTSRRKDYGLLLCEPLATLLERITTRARAAASASAQGNAPPKPSAY